MIGAFADVGRILDDASFVRIATEAADFILAEMTAPDGGEPATAEPEAEVQPEAESEAGAGSEPGSQHDPGSEPDA
jgi:uncharacterized protein YyaL (SSP411 family)